MKYAQLVIGPAGSGKSTYCTVMQDHCKTINRNIFVVNLDPAAENFTYECAIDIRGLISVDDVLDDKELAFGPNGALIFCMEYLVKNLDWLHKQLDEAEDEYFLFDCPGQIELYSHLNVMQQLAKALQQWNFNVCSTFILDTTFCLDPDKFISAALIALSTMVSFMIPAVNVLSKMDLLSKEDRRYIEEILDDSIFQIFKQRKIDKWDERHRKLTETIATVLSDYNMIRFLHVNIGDEEEIHDLLMAIDSSIQYGEDVDVRDRFPEEKESDNIVLGG